MIPGTNPLAEFYQNRKLDEVGGDLSSLRETVVELQRRVEGQAALLRAVFTYLREKQGFTEAELLVRFQRNLAERAAPTPCICPRCGRSASAKHQKCLYCEEPLSAASAFDLI